MFIYLWLLWNLPLDTSRSTNSTHPTPLKCNDCILIRCSRVNQSPQEMRHSKKKLTLKISRLLDSLILSFDLFNRRYSIKKNYEKDVLLLALSYQTITVSAYKLLHLQSTELGVIIQCVCCIVSSNSRWKTQHYEHNCKLTHFRPMFQLRKNHVIRFYKQNIWKTHAKVRHFK